MIMVQMEHQEEKHIEFFKKEEEWEGKNNLLMLDIITQDIYLIWIHKF